MALRNLAAAASPAPTTTVKPATAPMEATSMKTSPSMAKGVAVEMVPAVIAATSYYNIIIWPEVAIVRPRVRSRIPVVVVRSAISAVTALKIGRPGTTTQRQEEDSGDCQE